MGLAEAWGSLKSMRFNQDKTAFCCAFQDGARVFNLEPIRERAHYTEDQVRVQGAGGTGGQQCSGYRVCCEVKILECGLRCRVQWGMVLQ